MRDAESEAGDGSSGSRGVYGGRGRLATGIDAVYIPLPNHLHAEWVKKAADAGKHVLCEKPFALDAAQADEAVRYAESRGVKVMEAFMYRFHPQWVHAREVVRSGEIGKVQFIHTQFTFNNRDPRNIRNILSRRRLDLRIAVMPALRPDSSWGKSRSGLFPSSAAIRSSAPTSSLRECSILAMAGALQPSRRSRSRSSSGHVGTSAASRSSFHSM